VPRESEHLVDPPLTPTVSPDYRGEGVGGESGQQIQNGISRDENSSRFRGLVRSFYFAFAGLWFLLRTQRNARIEVSIGVIVCVLAAWLRIPPAHWALLIFTIALVLILEGLNTSIEAAVDLASPRRHPLAKSAKDLAAGMVLIAAMASVAVGLLILGPPLWNKLMR
jgi:diacylglycerol kinase